MEGGYPESVAVTSHVGLIGQTITDQIPLTKVDPNRHPMEQLNETLHTATKLKDEAAKLCETISKIVEAAQKLSDIVHTVVRTAEAIHAESEDATQGAHDVICQWQTGSKPRSKFTDLTGMQT